VIIKLDRFDKLIINDTIVTVGAGYNLMKLSIVTANHSLSGLEFASGIPGTIGGAVYMNAGAYNLSVSDILLEIEALDEELNIVKLTKEDLKFNYRDSILKHQNYICDRIRIEIDKRRAYGI